MICKSYQDLNVFEKIKLIGKITHLIQCDENAFKLAGKIIQAGEDAGYFKNVQILPEHDFLTPKR